MRKEMIRRVRKLEERLEEMVSLKKEREIEGESVEAISEEITLICAIINEYNNYWNVCSCDEDEVEKPSFFIA